MANPVALPRPAAAARLHVPGAATASVRDRLRVPGARGVVVHAGATAAYAAVDGRCIGVLARTAVHVPCGILTALPALPPVRTGDPVELGDGVLLLGGRTVTVARVVPSAAPPLTDPEAAAALLAAALPGWTTRTCAALPSGALAALAAGDTGAVERLVGLGEGLTPLGDDLLAGWLAAARSAGHPALAAFRAEVARLAPYRTSLLSATLLACAADGETVPQFRDLMVALAAGSAPAADRAGAALLRVGHTSGAGLAVGALLALTPREGNPT